MTDRSPQAAPSSLATAILVAVAFLAPLALAAFDNVTFADGDTNWHVATGRWILDHRAIPTVDPFSFTVPGRRWVAHEWLSEALLAAVQRLGGWAGVALLTGACGGAAMALMAAQLRRMLGMLSAIACVGLSLAILRVHLLARPHVLALPLLVLWTAELVEARRAGRAPPLWLAPLMTLWANLHGSYVFGLAFSVPFALEAWRLTPRADRGRVIRGWGLFLALSGAAALLNPNGVDDLLLPLQVMRLQVLRDIGEWRPADLAQVSPLVIAVFLALFVCLYRGVRFGWERLALLLLLLFMTLQHVRQEIVLAAAGPLLLAQPLGAALEPTLAAAPAVRSRWSAGAALALGLGALVAVGLAGLRLAQPMPRLDSATTPVAALAHVPAALRGRPVFNSYSFGGWLILNGVRPFIDGRADMYGDAFVRLALDTEAAKDPQAALATLRRYGVVWSITVPGSGLIAVLDRTPGWRRLYQDRWAVVQVYAPVQAPAPNP